MLTQRQISSLVKTYAQIEQIPVSCKMVVRSVAFSEALLNIRSQGCGFMYKNRFVKDKLLHYNTDRLFDGGVVWFGVTFFFSYASLLHQS